LDLPADEKIYEALGILPSRYQNPLLETLEAKALAERCQWSFA
jgi:hypothetical protein